MRATLLPASFRWPFVTTGTRDGRQLVAMMPLSLPKAVLCLSILQAAMLVACGFPAPPLLPDDAGPSGTCQGDEGCSAPTPYCVDTVCSACRTSDTCPAAAPVCDATSHACRTCSKDSECDSGACDLAGGTCVGRASILYASPTGNNANPCTQVNPCSLEKASSIADVAHPYIVLQLGVYRSNAILEGVTVTVCGNSATVDTNSAGIHLRGGAAVSIRDLKLIQGVPVSMFGAGTMIQTTDSDLTLDNVDFASIDLYAIQASGGTLTIRNSRIRDAFVQASSTVIIDRTLVSTNSGITLLSSSQRETSLEITNSIFIAPPTRKVIQINNPTDSTSSGGAVIVNNTFVGGSIDCGGSALYGKGFASNIFYNTGTLSKGPGCQYDYNLFMPAVDMGGMGNIAGDPKFVNLSANDFHLTAGSPAIDAGPQSTVFNSHDYDGTTRPQGTRTDIGAFEYVP